MEPGSNDQGTATHFASVTAANQGMSSLHVGIPI